MRIHNFCAGPCTLPLDVLEEVQSELLDFEGSGMSVIEMSHRSAEYEAVHEEALALFRENAAVPEDFTILFLQGGATLQFALVPMNLLREGTRAGYVRSGTWGKGALKDAALWGDAYAAWDGEPVSFSRMPSDDELEIQPDTRYLHVTSNETIEGIRMSSFPDIDLPLVGDMSSDYLSRPVPWERFDLVYGGAQKNLGPAGLAVIVVRTSLLEEMTQELPSYLRLGAHADKHSLMNTPPMFAIYVTGKVLRWMRDRGGVAGMEERAAGRSGAVYDAIDRSRRLLSLTRRAGPSVAHERGVPDAVGRAGCRVPRGSRGARDAQPQGPSKRGRDPGEHLQRDDRRRGRRPGRVHGGVPRCRRMSTLVPFPARIVRPEWAEHVVSPMHDALSREERAEILAERPYAWLHVSRTPEDAPEGQEVDPAALDEANVAALQRLLDADLFEGFPEPALYVYRLRSAVHEQTGIVGEVPPQAFVDGRILGHEGVQPERVDALGTHLSRLGARSTLVALMFRADDDVRKLVQATTDGAALRRFGSGELEQTVWRVDDPEAADRIRERFDDRPLYITDGHHRAMASVELWERAGRPQGAGVPAVLFPDEQLRMLAFHRRVVGPLPFDVDELLSHLRERVRVEPVGGQPGERGVFGLYVGGRWYRLAPGPGGAAAGVESLDVSRLHRLVIEPIFGFGEAGDPGLEFVSDAVPVEELTSRVDEDGGAAFTLVPPTFDQFVEVADRHEQMPAKATYFDPKPQSGLFLKIGEDEGINGSRSTDP